MQSDKISDQVAYINEIDENEKAEGGTLVKIEMQEK
eukprot:CAMPEP_0170564180 /NCGR_PEP_ID=MMETSP0211-20121228/71464_1 /TAXON_ID=311385 /ORGANISM="Pseudokeronopsis sp., Strain OXSARD2" /LENGTH=35 /DNA_ID= /DNA_START= /DNA_END= /DNA_ORIENTATION=